MLMCGFRHGRLCFLFSLLNLSQHGKYWSHSHHTSVPQVPVMEGYTYVPDNHSDNVSHGGVGLFYKDNLHISVRSDLSFNESLVLELKFPRRKIFFTVLYRSPSFNSKSILFSNFLENLKNLHSLYLS